MTERVLVGPFLTRAQVARHLGVPAEFVVHRPDLLRVRSRWLPEAYFAFQFTESGIRTNVGAVVAALQPDYDDVEIADWLVRPNAELAGSAPLAVLKAGGDADQVLAAAAVAGPVTEDGPTHAVPQVDPAPTQRTQARRQAAPRPAPSH